MKFRVTKSDIQEAFENGGGATSCPIAMCLRREFDLSEHDVNVVGDYITLKHTEYATNKKILKFIERYDRAQEAGSHKIEKLKEFSFTLPVKQVKMWDFEVGGLPDELY